jgi:hypothetical protein
MDTRFRGVAGAFSVNSTSEIAIDFFGFAVFTFFSELSPALARADSEDLVEVLLTTIFRADAADSFAGFDSDSELFFRRVLACSSDKDSVLDLRVSVRTAFFEEGIFGADSSSLFRFAVVSDFFFIPAKAIMGFSAGSHKHGKC